MAGEYIEFNNSTQPAINDNNLNLLQQLIKQDIQGAASGDTLPIGAILPFGSDTIPENWLLCDGSAVSRTTYQDLFNTIGTSYGQGDGFTTFNLPDLRGRVGVGKSSDTEFDTLGETGGEKKHTLTVAEMPSHTHDLTPNNNLYAYNFGGTAETAVVIASDAGKTQGRYYQTISAAAKGGGEPHNILQPYIVTNYIIKAYQSAGVVATVVDNLNSNSGTDALSAKQGKILNDKLSNMITVGLNDSQTNPDGSDHIVAFNVTKYLLGSAFTLQNDGGIKCNVACDIEVNATLRFGYSASSTKNLRLYKNSEQLIGLSQQSVTANTQTVSSYYLSVNVNDVIYLKGQTQNSGEISSFVAQGTYMSIKRIN